MRVIGLDVHRSFAQVAELKDGVLRQRGRLDPGPPQGPESSRARSVRMTRWALRATGNTMAIVRLLKPHAGRVVIANPLQVRGDRRRQGRATDRIDAAYSRGCRRQATCQRSGSPTRRRSSCAGRSRAALASSRA